MSRGLVLFTCLSILGCNEAPAPVSVLENIPGMVLIPSGTLNMGGDNDQASPDEYPKHKIKIDAFFLDEAEVTNREFLAFTEETGYETIAEREILWEEIAKDLPPGTPKPPDSILQPGALVFHKTANPVPLNDPSQWWEWKIGASWKHPQGVESSIDGILDHPVVQIAWDDAKAYAAWAGKRLPTESEWEWAARGGEEDNLYPWGNEDAVVDGHKFANFWQGMFPYENSNKDGYLTTAPVKKFPPNGYGLYDMAGNVWEWCEDWYDANYYQNEKAVEKNNVGPDRSFNPANPYAPAKVLRGGSFLCNDDYCSGYRNARRMQSSPDTGLNHTGFRCARDVK